MRCASGSTGHQRDVGRRVPRAQRRPARQAPHPAPLGRRRLQGVQEHLGALRRPRSRHRDRRAVDRPDRVGIRHRQARRLEPATPSTWPRCSRPSARSIHTLVVKGGVLGDSSSRHPRPRRSPRSNHARSCWRSWPERWLRRCSSSPVCSKPCLATLPTGSRRSSTRAVASTLPPRATLSRLPASHPNRPTKPPRLPARSEPADEPQAAGESPEPAGAEASAEASSEPTEAESARRRIPLYSAHI